MRSLPAAPPAGGPTFRASSSRGERCVQTGWYGFAKDVSEPPLVASERMRRVNPERSAYDLYGDPGTLSICDELDLQAYLARKSRRLLQGHLHGDSVGVGLAAERRCPGSGTSSLLFWRDTADQAS